jgi:hypothetical protein
MVPNKLPQKDFDLGRHLGAPNFLEVHGHRPLRQAEVDRPCGVGPPDGSAISIIEENPTAIFY